MFDVDRVRVRELINNLAAAESVAGATVSGAIGGRLAAAWAKERVIERRHAVIEALFPGYSETRAYVCARRLLGKKCLLYLPWDEVCEPHEPPHADHGEMIRVRGQYVLIEQPYDLGPAEQAEVIAWASEHELACYIDRELSWHLPGSTTLVVIAAKPVIS